MKLYKSPKKKPEAVDLKRLVKAFQVVSMALVSALKDTPVTSEDELETVTQNVQDTLEMATAVLSRVLSLSEGSEMARLDDIELGVKLDREQQQVLYLVDIATTMLDRLYNLRHISQKEYLSLSRYWRSIPVQHHLLVERWAKARA